VLEHQGIPAEADPGERTRALLQEALDGLCRLAAPLAVFQEITAERFEEVHRGEGRNEPRTPLQGIFPGATRLALFAATLGPAVSARISALFAASDFARASMLDAAASEATEKAGDELERRFLDRLELREGLPQARLVRYSPGYCGWHLSGQRALFQALRPEEIGLSLRESFLMEPLKSMTGLMACGPAAIHLFKPDYPFCKTCRDRGCRRRMQEVMVPDHQQRGS
jgi:hypothetical protein